MRIYHFLAFKTGREYQCSVSDHDVVIEMAKHLKSQGWNYRVRTEVSS